MQQRKVAKIWRALNIKAIAPPWPRRETSVGRRTKNSGKLCPQNCKSELELIRNCAAAERKMRATALVVLSVLFIVLSFHQSEATFSFLTSMFNSIRSSLTPVNPQDTSDGRFAKFNGPVKGLPEGHGGGQFGAADCLLCPEGQ